MATNWTRRDFLALTGSAGAASPAAAPGAAGGVAWSLGSSADAVAGWARVPAILARIVPPTFPARDFDITRFGAVGDGARLCTEAIARRSPPATPPAAAPSSCRRAGS